MTTRDTVEVEFRLEGASKTADKATMASLGQVLQSWSNLIESVHNDGGRPPAAEVHKLVAVRVQAGSLRVFSEVPPSHLPALKLVSESVRTGSMALLPAGSRGYMHECVDQLKRAQHVLRIVENKRAGLEGAVLIDAPAEAPEARINGQTTLVGRLRAIGGVKPTLHLESRPRPITIGATVEQAREVAAHLYQVIVVDVAAEWSIETAEIASCRLLDWRPGPDTGFVEGVHAMAAHHGHAWDGVDTVEWLRQLRDDE